VQLVSPHIDEGTATIAASGTSGNITLDPAFTSATSFICTVSGHGGTVTSDYRYTVNYTNGSTIVITNTGVASTVGFICVGN
jgi:hypothetical protein